MAAKKTVSTRIDEEWFSAIEQICRETGQDFADWLRDAIALKLGSESPQQARALVERVEALEKKLQGLAGLLTR
ncbi:hypothetical protein AMR42_15110 [Limnothrix sp. PR1529]|uniref:hypothetical protein n=1 Tax=Limnothrix sp. PR1529 TaxID=1704291 RepID=UPI000C14D371|nr:hypothetical protein [Limnothrix sp. PR1529]PIB06281.1 hypothetical protein AMR42_15110 [Limnothrix sp. PR1529]